MADNFHPQFFGSKAVRLTSSGGGGHKSLQEAIFEGIREATILDLADISSCLHQDKDAELKNQLDAIGKKIASQPKIESCHGNELNACIKKLADKAQDNSDYDKIKSRLALLEQAIQCLNDVSTPDTDILISSVAFGKLGKLLWDFSQRHEMVWIQRLLLKLQNYANKASGEYIYNKVGLLLAENNPEVIIDTQAMGTKAICKAVVEYNYKNNTKIRVKKYSTDTPTNKCTHYLDELKTLSIEEQQVLDLHMLVPLKYSEESSDDFWKRWCGNNVEVYKVDNDDVDLGILQKNNEKEIAKGIRVYQLDSPQHWPIRPLFKSLSKLSTDELKTVIAEKPIKIKLNNNIDDKALQAMNLVKQINTIDDNIDVIIKPSDKVMSVMLGSNGGKSIEDYTQRIIETCKSSIKTGADDDHYYLFAFCGQSNYVQKRIINSIKDDASLPKNLHVIPLGFQSGGVVANIQARSDTIITRTGGTATMEALAVCKGQILIHSQERINKKLLGKLKNENTLEQTLEDAIPVWEGGNATYIKSRRTDARVVNPDTFIEHQKFITQPQEICSYSSPGLTH